MKNIELKPNENIIDYIINHSEEFKDAHINLLDVDLSKYGFIESKNCRIIEHRKNFIERLKNNKNKPSTYIIDYEYFLKDRKDISMIVRETSVYPGRAEKTRELLKVFKNHDYIKTLFSTQNMDEFDSMILARQKVKKSGLLTKDIFGLKKDDCVSDFIVNNKAIFEGKGIIIHEDEIGKNYLGLPSNPDTPFVVTPVNYKFKGQQNVVQMKVTPVRGDKGYYFINGITKKIHIATPVYDSANAKDGNLVKISETKTMTQ